jgi:NDP-sugar pyrophosphorylase family protein
MGIYILRRDAVLPFVVPNEPLDMPVLMQSMQQSGRSVFCHSQDCFWLDIGRPEDFAEAQAIVERNPGAFVPARG